MHLDELRISLFAKLSSAPRSLVSRDRAGLVERPGGPESQLSGGRQSHSPGRQLAGGEDSENPSVTGIQQMQARSSSRTKALRTSRDRTPRWCCRNSQRAEAIEISIGWITRRRSACSRKFFTYRFFTPQTPRELSDLFKPTVQVSLPSLTTNRLFQFTVTGISEQQIQLFPVHHESFVHQPGHVGESLHQCRDDEPVHVH